MVMTSPNGDSGSFTVVNGEGETSPASVTEPSSPPSVPSFSADSGTGGINDGGGPRGGGAVLPRPSTVCSLCGENYQSPKVLACFHTFCKCCLEKLVDSPKRIICPTCRAETQLCADQGVDSLLTDYAAANLIEEQMKQIRNEADSDSSSVDAMPSSRTPNGVVVHEDGDENFSSPMGAVDGHQNQQPSCTGCKSKDSSAVAHCYDCANFLCANCVMAHQFMHCFEGHRVVDLSDLDANSLNVRPVKCLQHKQESLKYFCFSCNIPICKDCTVADHPRACHQYENIADVGTAQVRSLPSAERGQG